MASYNCRHTYGIILGHIRSSTEDLYSLHIHSLFKRESDQPAYTESDEYDSEPNAANYVNEEPSALQTLDERTQHNLFIR